MLPGGSILGGRRPRQAQTPPGEQPPPEGQPPGGAPTGRDAGELVQEGWDGQVERSFRNREDDGTGTMIGQHHHDYQREGNPVGYYAPGQEFVDQGKLLILAHKNKVVPEIREEELVDDFIYEFDWNGNLTGFEWHAADHFNEYGFDESAKEDIHKSVEESEETSGSISGGRRPRQAQAPPGEQRPGGPPPGKTGDWLHINSMSLLGQNHWYDETGDERFNPENIIISACAANFIAIISRVTGGIVWRVGPDFVEGTPEYNLGQIVAQHHPHMIPKGLPGEGNILVFDNGGRSGYGGPTGFPRYRRQYSRVIEFNPVTLEIVWQYGTESGEEKFFSHYISSAQRLPNGNTLITEGANGRLFEVTPDKEVVWEFIVPSMEGQPPAGGPPGGPPGGKSNAVYRAYRIPPEWVPGNPAGYAEWATLYK